MQISVNYTNRPPSFSAGGRKHFSSYSQSAMVLCLLKYRGKESKHEYRCVLPRLHGQGRSAQQSGSAEGILPGVRAEKQLSSGTALRGRRHLRHQDQEAKRVPAHDGRRRARPVRHGSRQRHLPLRPQHRGSAGQRSQAESAGDRGAVPHRQHDQHGRERVCADGDGRSRPGGERQHVQACEVWQEDERRKRPRPEHCLWL